MPALANIVYFFYVSKKTTNLSRYIARVVDIIGYCKGEEWVEPRKKRKTAKDKEAAEYENYRNICRKVKK